MIEDERKTGLSHLYALSQSFAGGPAYFMTISPGEMNNSLCLKLAAHGNPKLEFVHEYKITDDEKECEDTRKKKDLQTLKFDAKLMTENPVVAARIYDKLVKAIVELLVGIPITRWNKKTLTKRLRGIFGEVQAIYGVIIGLTHWSVPPSKS